MTFWSGEKLAQELPQLIPSFSKDRIDHAAYQLSVGEEIFIPVTHGSLLNWRGRLRAKTKLKAKERFIIESGQYAFLLTEETVEVPANALALISMRAHWKWKGLVNVSGFHVDPGFSGKLIFTVFNSGPNPIALQRGEPCFLIWYADLDRTSNMIRTQPGFTDIPNKLVDGMVGGPLTLQGLAERIGSIENRVMTFLATLAVTVIIGIVVGLLAVGITVWPLFSQNWINQPKEATTGPSAKSEGINPPYTLWNYPPPKSRPTNPEAHQGPSQGTSKK